jgi:hypothetical protein
LHGRENGDRTGIENVCCLLLLLYLVGEIIETSLGSESNSVSSSFFAFLFLLLDLGSGFGFCVFEGGVCFGEIF